MSRALQLLGSPFAGELLLCDVCERRMRSFCHQLLLLQPEAFEYHQTKAVDCPNLTFSDHQRSIAGGKTSLNKELDDGR
jgi:hypothetical protein